MLTKPDPHPFLARSATSMLSVEPAPHETKQPLRHEDDHGDEDDSHRDEVVLGEEARQGLAQQQEEPGADDGSDERADPAHDVEDHRLAGNEEEDEIRRGELVLQRVENAG